MHRPPGREAYPGDIFYLHARLLERSTRLSAAHGGGSLTALPIVETEEGEIAAYIPTNLISITDGQIYLDRRLFAAGVLPAVDVPLSVSRIGGKAQHPRIKEEAGRMKLDYLQFLELEVFTRFGTKLEAGTEAKIRRGRLLREILKQERLSPQPAVFELAWLIAFNAGLLDHLDAATLPTALQRILAGIRREPLLLDAGRDEWLVRLQTWLESCWQAARTLPAAGADQGNQRRHDGDEKPVPGGDAQTRAFHRTAASHAGQHRGRSGGFPAFLSGRR